MISLHDYSGIKVDKANLLITVKAGTILRNISKVLDGQHQLAMINLGSVAEQSLGGAISTGELLLVLMQDQKLFLRSLAVDLNCIVRFYGLLTIDLA